MLYTICSNPMPPNEKATAFVAWVQDMRDRGAEIPLRLTGARTSIGLFAEEKVYAIEPGPNVPDWAVGLSLPQSMVVPVPVVLPEFKGTIADQDGKLRPFILLYTYEHERSTLDDDIVCSTDTFAQAAQASIDFWASRPDYFRSNARGYQFEILRHSDLRTIAVATVEQGTWDWRAA